MKAEPSFTAWLLRDPVLYFGRHALWRQLGDQGLGLYAQISDCQIGLAQESQDTGLLACAATLQRNIRLAAALDNGEPTVEPIENRL